MSYTTGSDSANFNNYANWNGLNDNITTPTPTPTLEDLITTPTPTPTPTQPPTTNCPAGTDDCDCGRGPEHPNVRRVGLSPPCEAPCTNGECLNGQVCCAFEFSEDNPCALCVDPVVPGCIDCPGCPTFDSVLGQLNVPTLGGPFASFNDALGWYAAFDPNNECTAGFLPCDAGYYVTACCPGNVTHPTPTPTPTPTPPPLPPIAENCFIKKLDKISENIWQAEESSGNLIDFNFGPTDLEISDKYGIPSWNVVVNNWRNFIEDGVLTIPSDVGVKIGGFFDIRRNCVEILDEGFQTNGHDGSRRRYIWTPDGGFQYRDGAIVNSPWTVTDLDEDTVFRIDFEGDANCLKQNFNTQTSVLKIFQNAKTNGEGIDISWVGIGEVQDRCFDAMNLKVNGSLVAYSHSPGGKKGCLNSTRNISTPNSRYTGVLKQGLNLIEIIVSTKDPFFHKGSAYSFTVSNLSCCDCNIEILDVQEKETLSNGSKLYEISVEPSSNNCCKLEYKKDGRWQVIPDSQINCSELNTNNKIFVTLGDSGCPTPTPAPPTPLPPPPTCPPGTDLLGYRVVVYYSNAPGTKLGCGSGQHACNNAIFRLLINDNYIGEVNLNNVNDGGPRDSSFIINDSVILGENLKILLDCALPSCHNGIAGVAIFDLENRLVFEQCMPNDQAVFINTGSVGCYEPTPTATPPEFTFPPTTNTPTPIDTPTPTPTV